MAVAEASLRTVIEAMSEGFSRLSGLRGNAGDPTTPDIPWGSVATLLIGTPSITYSGSLLLLIELPPRIRICDPAPGSPLFSVISTPAARPESICVTLVVTPTLACAGLIVETDPVMASRRCVPYPVTTTASRSEACGASANCASAVPPAVTVTDCRCGEYPIRVARTSTLPAGTDASV